jgi:hypothetical protein
MRGEERIILVRRVWKVKRVARVVSGRRCDVCIPPRVEDGTFFNNQNPCIGKAGQNGWNCGLGIASDGLEVIIRHSLDASG